MTKPVYILLSEDAIQFGVSIDWEKVLVFPDADRAMKEIKDNGPYTLVIKDLE